MSFLYDSGSNSKIKPEYTGMSIQTSVEGLCIPVVFGVERLSGNMLWYGDFQSKAVKQDTGKGGGETTTGYKYYAAFIMGLCEGPLQGCDDIASPVFDDDSTPDTIITGSSINVYITGGVPPFTFETENTGYNFEGEGAEYQTNNRNVTLNAVSGCDAVCAITVTDACGHSINLPEIRNTTEGSWSKVWTAITTGSSGTRCYPYYGGTCTTPELEYGKYKWKIALHIYGCVDEDQPTGWSTTYGTPVYPPAGSSPSAIYNAYFKDIAYYTPDEGDPEYFNCANLCDPGIISNMNIYCYEWV